MNIQEEVEKIIIAEQALDEIRNRSFSGRHPELGKMVNCQVCGLRHRQNERDCKQKFAEKDGKVYGELVPPEGLTQLTAKQVVGAKVFSKKRIKPHSNRYLQAKLNKLEAKKKLDNKDKVV